MVQLLALQARETRINPGSLLAEAERIKNARMTNASNEIKLGQQRDEASALEAFRGAAREGDPDAVSKLAGYPEHQKKLMEAFDGMSPEDAQKALTRAREVGEAAQYVAGFTEGTPERQEAWNAQLGDLARKGYITKEQADHWVAQGPSELVLQQAVDAADFVMGRYGTAKGRTAALKGDKVQAEIDKINEQIKTETGPKRAKLIAERNKLEAGTEKIEADTELSEAKTGTELKRQDKIGADTDLSKAKATTEGEKAETQGAKTTTELARTDKVKADTDLSRAKTTTEGARTKKVEADTGLATARTGQVKNKTQLETTESAADVDNTEADTGLKKAQTKKVETETDTGRSVGEARIKNIEDQIKKRTSKAGGGAGLTPKDRIEIEKALKERRAELMLDLPLPADASPEEVQARKDAEAQFEKDTAGLRSMLPENQPSKQGPAEITAEGGTKPATGMEGDGSQAAPFKNFTRADFEKWPKGTIFINPKDGRALVKR